MKSTKYNIENVKNMFLEKDYTLLSDEYINKNTKLDYICNKHKDFGIQQVTLASFKRNKCNCKKCIHENSIGKHYRKRVGLLEKYKDDYLLIYQNKLNNLKNGNEYKLIDVYTKNEKTYLKLLHVICGNIYEVNQWDFFKNNCRCQNKECKHIRKSKQCTKSIEKLKQEIFDLVGDEYELCSDYYGTNEKAIFKHKICNQTFEMTPHNFLAGQRCTHCINPTKGEQKIINYLNKCNIDYIFQKSFDGLLGINGNPLSYDFYIRDYNLLIEYQGNFHDGTVNCMTEEKLKYQQEHDRRKREYAKLHNIDLLEIWYYDFDEIENIIYDELLRIEEKVS